MKKEFVFMKENLILSKRKLMLFSGNPVTIKVSN